MSETALVVSDKREENIEDILASVASSYSIDHTSFETSLTSLLERAHNELGKDAPYWSKCAGKILTAFSRAKGNPDPFKTMFFSFFEAHADSLREPLFKDDDDRINDAFFKSTSPFPAPKTSSAASANVKSIEGPVVYFRMDAAHLASACVPIGEIYRAAIRAYVAADGNLSMKLAPTLTLLDFYAVLYHSLPDDHPDREALALNISELCDSAEATAPGSGPGAQKSSAMDGNPFDSIAGLLSAFTGGQGSQMSDAIRGVGGVVKNLVDKITEGGAPIGKNPDGSIDPTAIVGRLGDVFQSPEIQRQIAETAKTASAAFGGLTGMMSGVTGDSSDALGEIPTE
jgi:hypothetical protein